MFRKLSDTVFNLFSNSSQCTDDDNKNDKKSYSLRNNDVQYPTLESLRNKRKLNIMKDMKEENDRKQKLDEYSMRPSAKRAKININSDIAKSNIEQAINASVGVNDSVNSLLSVKKENSSLDTKSNYEAQNVTSTASLLLNNINTNKTDVVPSNNCSFQPTPVNNVISYQPRKRRFRLDKSKSDKFVINKINENSTNTNIFSIPIQRSVKELNEDADSRNYQNLDIPTTKMDFSAINRHVSLTQKQNYDFNRSERKSNWKCNRCNQVNIICYNFCPNCGNANPLNTKEDNCVKNKVLKTDNWICMRCQTKNKVTFKKCQCCFLLKDSVIPESSTHSKETSTRSKQLNNKWNCSTCLVDNDKCVCLTEKSNKTNEINQGSLKVISRDNMWNCPTCMVDNKNDEGRCVCCQTLKPKPSKVNNDILKIDSEKWNCPTCLVENNSTLDKCSCCLTPKPNKTNETEKSEGLKLITPDNMWNCPRCMVDNKNDEKRCVCCQTENPKLKNVNNFFQKQSQKTDKWNCPTCMVDNDNSVDKCLCCQTNKPKSQLSESTKFKFSSANKWNCPTCMVDNDNSVDKCLCCQTNKPKSQLTESTKLNFSSANKWNCPTCMVDNDNSVDKCLCCQTNKPKSQLTESTKLNFSSANKWNCPTCMVDNDLISDACVCCKTKNPKISSETKSAEKIKFGSELCNLKEPSKFGFGLFGSNQTEPLKTRSAQTIVFGTKSGEASEKIKSKETIKFGSNSTDVNKNQPNSIKFGSSEPVKFGSGSIMETKSKESIKFGSSSTNTVMFGLSESVKFGSGLKVESKHKETIFGSRLEFGSKDIESANFVSTESIKFGSRLEDNSITKETIKFGLKSTESLKFEFESTSKENSTEIATSTIESVTNNILNGLPNNKWNCLNCFVDNDNECQLCISCSSKKPSDMDNREMLNKMKRADTEILENNSKELNNNSELEILKFEFTSPISTCNGDLCDLNDSMMIDNDINFEFSSPTII